MPPSTTIMAPLVQVDSSEARYKARLTISSGRPKRPLGLRARRTALASGLVSSQLVMRGVSIGPGQIAFDRMPCGPNCTANDFVSAITAPLLAVYASCGTEQPTNATNDAMLTIEPPLPDRCINGMPYLQPKATPFTLTASTRSQTASSVSVTEWSACGKIPA